MESRIGRAVYRRGKLHFDEMGWTLVKAVARRMKKSPTQVVNGALMRYIRSRDGKKTKNT